MNNDHRDPVTVLGLGAMGSALAAAFLAGGHPTTVWNRTASKADALVAKGAHRAESVTAAVAASPLVVTCLVNYRAWRQVLERGSDAFAERVLVNLTNGTPADAEAAAAWAAARGAGYLDGGIMAVPSMIGGPDAFVLYSGARAAYERHQPTLRRLGGTHFAGEDLGAAARYDLALLSAMYGMFAGARHAVALVGERAAPEFAVTLLAPWLAAMSAEAVPRAPGADDGSNEDSPLGMQAAALANIVAASHAAGLDPDLLTHLITPMREIVDAGEGGQLRALIQDLATQIHTNGRTS